MKLMFCVERERERAEKRSRELYDSYDSYGISWYFLFVPMTSVDPRYHKNKKVEKLTLYCLSVDTRRGEDGDIGRLDTIIGHPAQTRHLW